MMQQAMPQPQVQTQQIQSTVMETQMQAVPRTVMIPQRSQTMQQTMETIMQPQPRTVMVQQPQTTMRMVEETHEIQVPFTTFHEETRVVKRTQPRQEYYTVEEEI